MSGIVEATALANFPCVKAVLVSQATKTVTHWCNAGGYFF